MKMDSNDSESSLFGFSGFTKRKLLTKLTVFYTSQVSINLVSLKPPFVTTLKVGSHSKYQGENH